MMHGGNTNRTLRAAAAFGVAFVIGLPNFSCASKQFEAASDDAKPMWVDRPQEGADGRVLVGVGVGRTRPMAVDAAFARLAQSIQVRIIADEKARSSGETRVIDGQRTGSAQSSMDRSVRLVVDQRLAGVMIDRAWQNPTTGEWHARVLLDRKESGRALDQTVNELRRRSQTAQHRATAVAGWEQIAAWREALEATLEAIDAANARDAVLSSGAWAVSHDELLNAMETAQRGWDEARARARIAVQWTTSSSASIGRAVSDRINELGLLTLVGDADLVIQCDLSLVTSGAFDGRTRATQWELTIQALAPESRRFIASRRETGAAVSRNDPERAARDDAMRRLDVILPGFLNDVFARGGSL